MPCEQVAVGVVERGGGPRRCPARRSRRRSRTARRARAAAPSSAVRPTAAASATSCAASRRPAGSTTEPLRTSSPASRRLAPRLSPAGTITASPSARTSSCMNTVSAPRRHRRAGEDADRLAGADRRAPRRGRRSGARRSRAGSRPSAARSAMAHRVAVDRGIVERRQIDRRDHVGGQHAPARRGERHASRSRRPAATRSAISRSISAIGSSGPENAKQSSVSCAITRSACAAAALERHGVLEQHVGDALDVVEIDHRHLRPPAAACRRRWRRCADRPDAAAACRWRRGGFRAWETASRLKPSTSTRSTGDELAEQVGQVPLRLAAQLVQDGEALGRADHHLGRAGGAVHERILARLVEVEAVMGVLERRHPQAARDQARQHLGDQRGLARAAPAGESDDAHGAFGIVHGAAYSKNARR